MQSADRSSLNQMTNSGQQILTINTGSSSLQVTVSLGMRLDPQSNEAHAPVISASRADIPSVSSVVTVRVIQTDEDLMIARHTRCLISASASPQRQ